jgi:hypothetical protein
MSVWMDGPPPPSSARPRPDGPRGWGGWAPHCQSGRTGVNRSMVGRRPGASRRSCWWGDAALIPGRSEPGHPGRGAPGGRRDPVRALGSRGAAAAGLAAGRPSALAIPGSPANCVRRPADQSGDGRWLRADHPAEPPRLTAPDARGAALPGVVGALDPDRAASTENGARGRHGLLRRRKPHGRVGPRALGLGPPRHSVSVRLGGRHATAEPRPPRPDRGSMGPRKAPQQAEGAPSYAP